MNKKINILVAVTLFCLFWQCSQNKEEDPPVIEIECEPDISVDELIIAKDCCFPDVVDKYIYTIGTEEWNNMLLLERLEAVQLPDSVLKSISSFGLIRSFIDMPFEVYYLYFESNQFVPRVYYRFNSLKELIKRNDGAKSLIAFYAATKLDCVESLIESNSFLKYREFILRLNTLELLFSQLEILGKLCPEDRKIVVETSLIKYWQWYNTPPFDYPYGYLYYGSPNNIRLGLMVYLMYDDMLPYFDKGTLDYVKYYGNPLDIADDIIAFADKFILK